VKSRRQCSRAFEPYQDVVSYGMAAGAAILLRSIIAKIVVPMHDA